MEQLLLYYDFTVYRKPAITNVKIKPHSNYSPHITIGVLKGFGRANT